MDRLANATRNSREKSDSLALRRKVELRLSSTHAFFCRYSHAGSEIASSARLNIATFF